MTEPTPPDVEGLIERLAVVHPSLARNRVWCRTCRATSVFSSVAGFRYGWPKCCNETMTIDSPDEQRALTQGPDHDR